jgi:hypothetical protein
MKPLFRSPTGTASLGPVPGSEFGNKRPGHLHGGNDLNCRCGSPVICDSDGTCLMAGLSTGLGGNKCEIDHGILSDGKGHVTKFYHFGPKHSAWQDVISVRPGDKVKAGQTIGVGGDSGNATACHVHYEHWVNGRPEDPLQYLREYQVIRLPAEKLRLALAYPGSVGPDIPLLQARLKVHGFDPGPADGMWGDRTTAALLAFQTAHALTADGICGRASWTHLLHKPVL